MKLFLTATLFILAVISQLTLWPRLSFFGAAPNFVLAVVLFLAVFRDFKHIWAVFFLGLLMEILAGKFFGAASAALLFAFLANSWFAKQVFVKNSWLSWLALSGLGVFVYQTTWFLFLRLGLILGVYGQSAAADLREFVFRILPSSFLLNTALTLAGFYFLKVIFKKADERLA